MKMHPPPAPNQRIDAVDALRGFALAGIAIAHFTEQYIAAGRWESWIEPSTIDHVLAWVREELFWSKFFSIFSMLFGMSFAIMMGNASQRGSDFSIRFLWRLAVLMVFALLHQTIYRGDILTVYVVIGLCLPLFYRCPTGWLLAIAVFLLLGGGRFAYFALNEANLVLEFSRPIPELMAQYQQLVLTASPLEIARYNFETSLISKVNFQLVWTGRAYQTLGYFLIGLYFVRSGFMKNLVSQQRLLINTAVFTAITAVLFYFIKGALLDLMDSPFGFNSYKDTMILSVVDVFDIAVTALYVSVFLLLFTRNPSGSLSLFAPVGRMALTCYLMQSLIGVYLFYGWGLGQVGKLQDWQTTLIAIAIIVCQVLLCRWWLGIYRYGPLEWLWRCGTYTRLIPLRR